MAFDGEKILIVSHGSFGMHILQILFHMDTEAFAAQRKKIDPKQFAFPNCGIMKFRRNNGVWEMLELPCEPERFTDHDSPVTFPLKSESVY